ncbi:MAG: hypothetical protein LUH42_03300, partial [Oscillospiraceae bacterium]|nr:hypothetical protein [Oscillospiraceae bacterium]
MKPSIPPLHGVSSFLGQVVQDLLPVFYVGCKTFQSLQDIPCFPILVQRDRVGQSGQFRLFGVDNDNATVVSVWPPRQHLK